jgi:hypothetical protein
MILASESRRPGMKAERHCFVCRALLQDTDDSRCADCKPHVNALARVLGQRRRAAMAAREHEIQQLESLIGRVEGRLRKWQRQQG